MKGNYISGSTPQGVGMRMWLNQRKMLNFRLYMVSIDYICKRVSLKGLNMVSINSDALFYAKYII